MSVACLSVEQGFAYIVDWELSVLFFSNEHDADYALRDYEVDEELLSILRLREEWGRSEVLLEVLECLFAGWCPLKVFGLAHSAKE